MDPSVVWAAVSSVAGVAAVAVAAWQVRIGIADHRLRQAAARRDDKAISGAGVRRRPEAFMPPVRLPPRVEVLAGREDLLAGLHARLVGGPEPRTVALCGLGGVGKTSVAVEYAHRHLAEVRVCWQFPAEEPILLEADFAVLAAELGVRGPADARDPVASVHAVLARPEANWLLIFDNAPDRASVERFLPPAGPGRVLITTQSQHWPPGRALEVPVLGAVAAVGFLAGRTGSTDRAAAAELARELGGLPLALEQAAAYMRATGMGMEAYLQLFRSRQSELLAGGEAAGHPAHLTAPLGLALSGLGDRAPAALALMRLLAFLAPEPVPLGLFLGGPRAAAGPGAEGMPDGIAPLIGDPVAIADAIAALRRYSLVSLAGEGAVLVHRLVRAVTRAAPSAGDSGRWRQAAAALVDAAVPVATDSSPAAWSAYALLVPHARAVLDLTSPGMARIAEYLVASGSYAAALELWQQIADACTDDPACGPEHPATLRARVFLARAAGDLLDDDTGRDRYAALLPVLERALGPEHIDTLVTRSNLAFSMAATGDFGHARDHCAALVPVMERALGPEYPATLVTRGHLALFTGEAGDYESARDQCAALLPVMDRFLGPEDIRTLWARSSFAVLTGGAGDPGGARDQCAAMLPAMERILGVEHRTVLRTRNNLALLTAVAGEFGDARDQLSELVTCLDRVFGTEHVYTLIARDNLAVMTGLAGDPAGARDQCAALLPAIQRAFGPDQVDTLIARDNLAAWNGQACDTPRKLHGIAELVLRSRLS